MSLWHIVFGVAAWEAAWYCVIDDERRSLYERAAKAARSRGKPLLVVGAPDGDEYGCGDAARGDVVLDLRPACCANGVRASVEAIPYASGRFGAAFVSHVLEHVCDPFRAERELRRVTAGPVFVAYPRPWTALAYAVPGHTWLMRETPAVRAGRCDGEPPWFSYSRLRSSSACNVATRHGTRGVSAGYLGSWQAE